MFVKGIIIFKDLDNKKQYRVNDCIWLDSDEIYQPFECGHTNKMVIALRGQALFAYKHHSKRLDGGAGRLHGYSSRMILVPRIEKVPGERFQVDIELIGKHYNKIVLQQKFKFWLSLEPENKFEELGAD